MSWGGATGMDAGRAPLRHEWRVGAYPHHGTGAREPDEVGPDVSADGFRLFCRNKMDSTVRAKPPCATLKMLLLPPDSTFAFTPQHTTQHLIAANPAMEQRGGDVQQDGQKQ